MRTADCKVVETLLENHEPIELIDVRSKQEFREMHVPQAHSIPVAEISAPHLALRPAYDKRPIYLISSDNARASLASGVFCAAGFGNPTVVNGGMKAWLYQGLPVVRGEENSKVQLLVLGAILSALAVGVAIALHAFLVAALLLANTIALVMKFRSLRQPGWLRG